MDWLSNWVTWSGLLLAAHVVLVLTSASHALLNKESSRSTFGWIGFILYAPFFGALGYWLFGVNRVQTRSKKLSAQADIERGVLQRLYPEHADHAQHAEEAREHFGAAEWRMLQIGKALTRVPLSPNNRVLPLHNGEEAYPVMLDAIRRAKVSVWMTTYIFDTDAKGLEFIQALVDAKDRGVDVRVIIDGVGELYGFPLAGTRLRRQGVKVARFLPPKLIPPQVFVNLRNHRKLLVVDGIVAFSGGMNIGGRHMALDPNNKEPVQDVHFMFHGPIVYDFARLFLDDWIFSNRHDRRDRESLPNEEQARFLRERRMLKRRKTGPQTSDTGSVEVSFPRHIRRPKDANAPLPSDAVTASPSVPEPAAVEGVPKGEAALVPVIGDDHAVAAQVSDKLTRMRRQLLKKAPEGIHALAAEEDADAWCRLIKDGPDERLNKLETLLSSVISSARHRVLVISPYFLPTTSIESALINARLRGVKVEVVIPEESNEPLVHAAMYRSVRGLLERDVKIWMQPPPFAHSKIIIVDDSYVLIGSANMDPRSLRLNFELGVEIMDPALVTRLMRYYAPIMDASAPLTIEKLDARGFHRKMFDSVVWLFSPYL